MAQKIDKHSVDHRILALCGRQHGLITRGQLLEMRMTDREIERRVRSGRLHRVHRGVYAVGHERLTTEGRFLAAVLAFGRGAVLSHQSAAVLWGIRAARGPRVDVTVPTTGGRARRGAMIVHRSPLSEEEMTVHDGVPVTTVVRTLIDLADVLPRRALERAIDEAAYLRLDLAGLEPRRGRRGYGVLTRVLAEHEAGATWTRSDLEERMLALCRRSSLPTPEVNARVEGYEVDFVWRNARLVVETDGWAAHGTRKAFERDRLRDAKLTAAGWRVVRVTDRTIDVFEQQLAQLLAA